MKGLAAQRGGYRTILNIFVRAESALPAAQAPGYTDPSAPLVPELVPLVVDFVLKVAR